MFAPKNAIGGCPGTLSFNLPLSFEQATAYRKANVQYVMYN